MKLTLLNTPYGLVPCYDDDYDEKKKLKIGEEYVANISLIRNPKFHRKYFAMINLAWEYQKEERQRFFKNSVEKFRETLQMAAGYSETTYNYDLKAWTDMPKSIAFDKLDEAAFEELYIKVRQVLLDVFIKGVVSEEEFINMLANF